MQIMNIVYTFGLFIFSHHLHPLAVAGEAAIDVEVVVSFVVRHKLGCKLKIGVKIDNNFRVPLIYVSFCLFMPFFWAHPHPQFSLPLL